MMKKTKDHRPKTKWALALGLVLAIAGVAFGQSADKPALPQGHPSLEEMMSSTRPAPPLSGGTAMPGEMPAGHPSLEQLGGVADGATQPKATGKLTVTVLAGTAGGSGGAGEAVRVELVHRGIVLKKYDLKADAGGKVIASDIPIMPPVWAMVSVQHAGILQQVASPELNTETPEQAIEMKVFETTQQAPAWTVAMQHLIVQWNEEGTGLKVVEMISASTPGDRAWVGAPAGDGPVTMTIPLPAGAQAVDFGGSFDKAVTKIVDGNVVTGGPLFPGRSEYRLSYEVAAKDGKADLPIKAPAAVGNLMVFLPADGAQVTANGLGGGQVVDMGQEKGKVRMYRAENLQAGATVSLGISGIRAATEAAAAPVRGSSFTARNIALAGGFLIVLVALGMLLMKKPTAKKA